MSTTRPRCTLKARRQGPISYYTIYIIIYIYIYMLMIMCIYIYIHTYVYIYTDMKQEACLEALYRSVMFVLLCDLLCFIWLYGLCALLMCLNRSVYGLCPHAQDNHRFGLHFHIFVCAYTMISERGEASACDGRRISLSKRYPPTPLPCAHPWHSQGGRRRQCDQRPTLP